MRNETVLLVHNRYREPGGEEGVYEAEGRLLERFGHRVIRYERDSRDTAGMNAARLAARTVWSAEDHRALGEVVRRERVRLVHFHNTFPLISPAAHHAARAAGAAVVQTLHNFRLLCAGGMFLRNGAACEKCLGLTVPWPAVAHRCYRRSAVATGVVAGMQVVHRALGTWQTQVDAFIVLSRFARERFLAGGLPAERMFIGANGVELSDGGSAYASTPAGKYFLYVGRLEEEKGVAVLLNAWERLRSDTELRILGDGALRGPVEAAARRDSRIQWLGHTSRDDVLAQMRRAWALVFPSLCYENYPGVLAEAQAAGLPVIASRLGSGAEIVTDGGFGILFEPGDAAELAAAVVALSGDASLRGELSRRARARYEEVLTPARCHDRLLDIYEHALRHRFEGAGAAALSTSSDNLANHE